LKAIPEAHRGIFAFGMEFGVRIGELRALQWDCIEGNEVTIKRAFVENKLEESTKTGKRRYFELTPYAQEVLKSLPLTSSTFIFVRDDGKPYTDKNLNEIWRAACESAKVEHIPLKNAIRHSLGCQLLDEGVDIGIVQDIYGHSKMEMTKRYAKRTKARVTEALVKRRATVYLLNDTKKEST
jgi:integrase/recombinase XerD